MKWPRSVSNLAGLICDEFWPQMCVLCGNENASRPICDFCDQVLPRIANACPRCAAPHGDGSIACGACQSDPPPFSWARAPFSYAFPIDSALKSLKFSAHMYYVPAFANCLLQALDGVDAGVDGIVPVPLHRWRYARRGFNQATELARALGKLAGLPLANNVRRVRATASQSGLTAAERRKNLKNAFAVRGELPFRRPMIVDDVMTTGETCRRLSEVLLRHGAHEVGVLVVARAANRR